MSWSHAPFHFNAVEGVYIVTCGTYLKRPFYRDASDRDLFESQLFAVAKEHHLLLHAWCVLINHYHLIIDAPRDSLEAFFRHLHSIASIRLNQRHAKPGRKVWFQYRDTLITDERSYFARLKYVQENAVHHGVIANAMNDKWCSARWFADHASIGLVKAIEQASLDCINEPDDF